MAAEKAFVGDGLPLADEERLELDSIVVAVVDGPKLGRVAASVCGDTDGAPCRC